MAVAGRRLSSQRRFTATWTVLRYTYLFPSLSELTRLSVYLSLYPCAIDVCAAKLPPQLRGNCSSWTTEVLASVELHCTPRLAGTFIHSHHIRPSGASCLVACS
jgi:hypothetical protein